jgi:hypothetical protein
MQVRPTLLAALLLAPGCSSTTSPKDGTVTVADSGTSLDGATIEGQDSGNATGPIIPAPAGACPNFENGTVTFYPKTGGARTAVVTIGDAAKTTAGPLVLYWFATTSSPAEAKYGLPLDAVKAAGGIVVAPFDVADAGTFPWVKSPELHDDLADEIVACAAKQTKFDRNRIHTTGFSAGGLMATHLSFARSNYIASVAPYSGGTSGTFQNPANKFAAMIMVGGPKDIVQSQNFYTESQSWQSTLKAAGHFAMFCDHGGGHTLPTKLVPAVWQFFLDHPFGKTPSAYAAGKIPSSISAVCTE